MPHEPDGTYSPVVGERVHARERASKQRVDNARVVALVNTPSVIVTQDDGRTFVLPLDGCEFRPA